MSKKKKKRKKRERRAEALSKPTKQGARPLPPNKIALTQRVDFEKL